MARIEIPEVLEAHKCPAPAMPVNPPMNLLLDIKVFDHRLDNPVRIRQPFGVIVKVANPNQLRGVGDVKRRAGFRTFHPIQADCAIRFRTVGLSSVK